jgi:hypothetical protein
MEGEILYCKQYHAKVYSIETIEDIYLFKKNNNFPDFCWIFKFLSICYMMIIFLKKVGFSLIWSQGMIWFYLKAEKTL